MVTEQDAQIDALLEAARAEGPTVVGQAIDGAGTFGDAAAIATDPLGAVLSAGVEWLLEHISFLREPLDQLVGDPAAVQASSDQLAGIAAHIEDLTYQHAGDVRTLLSQWNGQAADAFAASMEQFCSELGTLSKSVDAAGAVTSMSGQLVSAMHDIVFGEISALIAQLIEGALIAAATAVISCGLSEVVYAGVAAGRAAAKAAELAAKIAKLVDALGRMADRFVTLTTIMQALAAATQRFEASEGSGGHGAPEHRDHVQQPARPEHAGTVPAATPAEQPLRRESAPNAGGTVSAPPTVTPATAPATRLAAQPPPADHVEAPPTVGAATPSADHGSVQPQPRHAGTPASAPRVDTAARDAAGSGWDGGAAARAAAYGAEGGADPAPATGSPGGPVERGTAPEPAGTSTAGVSASPTPAGGISERRPPCDGGAAAAAAARAPAGDPAAPGSGGTPPAGEPGRSGPSAATARKVAQRSAQTSASARRSAHESLSHIGDGDETGSAPAGAGVPGGDPGKGGAADWDGGAAAEAAAYGGDTDPAATGAVHGAGAAAATPADGAGDAMRAHAERPAGGAHEAGTAGGPAPSRPGAVAEATPTGRDAAAVHAGSAQQAGGQSAGGAPVGGMPMGGGARGGGDSEHKGRSLMPRDGDLFAAEDEHLPPPVIGAQPPKKTPRS